MKKFATKLLEQLEITRKGFLQQMITQSFYGKNTW